MVLTQAHAPTKALSDAESVVGQLPCELEADTVQLRVTFRVHSDTRRQFADDRAEVARLEPRRGSEGAAGRE